MGELEGLLCEPDPQEEELWEERTLSLLKDSKIDQELSASKAKKKEGKKHRVKWMKRPMVMPETILEFLNEDLRESAIRYLSNFLVEKREKDPDNYQRAGFLVFNSCSTMCVLLQEVVSFYPKMVNKTFDARSVKRLANVLTLFQSVAANGETRKKFVDSHVPNFMVPLILFESTIEVFDNLRAIALSVIGILCQFREPTIIQWAIESDIVEVCHTIVEKGSELTKVIAMHILEAVLQDRSGISYVCDSTCSRVLEGLMKTWNKLVTVLAVVQDPSPRLFFHIIRCYTILCTYDRGYNYVMNNLPNAVTDGSFHEIIEDFPIIQNLLHQLLLTVGKVTEDPPLRDQDYVPSEEVKAPILGTCAYDSASADVLALESIDNQDHVTFLPSSIEC